MICSWISSEPACGERVRQGVDTVLEKAGLHGTALNQQASSYCSKMHAKEWSTLQTNPVAHVRRSGTPPAAPR